MLFTLYGSPCIYYGTEIMLDGAHDPDCRRCMPWDELDRGEYDEIISQVKRLIKLKRELPELSSMEVRFINPGEHRKVQYLRGRIS